MPPTVAELSDVAFRFGATPVLRAVDLTIAPGETVGIFGANGSGKTTLLRILATLARPTNGSGTVLGARIGSAEVDEVRTRIGLIGHEHALAPGLTLRENLDLVASLLGGPEPGPEAALAEVGLIGAADRRVDHCSNGMRKRAEFARVLMSSPDLLLLDEAHVGLDPAASRLVEHLVRMVRTRGGATVLVSHERERAMPMIDRPVELANGTLGPPS